MRTLDVYSFSILVRAAAVHRIFLIPYSADDVRGWYLDIDHSDNSLTREMHTKRDGLRVFKTADAAIKCVREAGWSGSIAVVVDKNASTE